MEAYWLSTLGVLALCLLSVALAVYSGSSKGFAGKLSGPVIPADDDNPLYRIDRVHMNSVEALAPFVVPTMLAMMIGVSRMVLGLHYPSDVAAGCLIGCVTAMCTVAFLG